jgi:hypothetical protein
MAIKKFNAVQGVSVGNDIIIDVIDSSANVTANNLSVTSTANLGPVGNIIITGGQPNQILLTDGAGNLQWVDNLPTSETYTANSISQTGGVYVSGDLYSIQVFGDYAEPNGVYVLTDGTGSAPAWYVDIDYLNVTNFNLVSLNINYTLNSGHTIYVQLYNNTTSDWDSIGTYTGLGSYYAFALQVVNDVSYINTSASNQVKLRLYHSNGGSSLHTTSIDYAALELTNQGPQGPRGPTGATGNVGPGVASGGTTGQLLIKNSGTNYDTAWSSSVPSLTVTGNLVAGNISTTGVTYSSNTANSTAIGTGALIVDGGASFAKDVWIGGTLHAPNLDITTYTQLTVDVPLLYLSSNSVYPYNYDIGFYGHFRGNPANNYQHTGFIRNYTNDEWYLFSNIATEPDNSVVDLGNANIIYDGIRVGKITSSGNITATGNITVANANLGNLATANYYSGNGSLLSSITGANVTGTVANANYSTYSGTVLTNAQPNITSVGTLTSLGVSGTVTASTLVSNVATGTAPLTVTSTTRVSNLNVAYANVADFINVNTLSTGTQYLVLANAVSGNVAEGANSIYSVNVANGSLTATTFVGALSGNATTAGTVVTAAQPNITSVGTLSSLSVTGTTTSGNFATAGNITASRLVSNIATGTAPLTVTSTTKVANLNVDLLDGYDTASAATANTIPVRDTNGNLTANYFIGNGSQLTGIDATSIQNGNSNVRVAANGNVTFGVTGVANVIIVTSTGANITGTLNASGNANVGNIGATNAVFTNVSGNGSALTALNASNITTGTLAQARLANANVIINGVTAVLGTTNTITANTTQTLTRGTYLTGSDFNGGTATTWAVDATTTSTASKIVARDTNGSFAANVITANLTGNATTAGTVVTAAQPNITSVGTLTSLAVTGNITSGNLSTGGELSVTGNAVITGNLTVNGSTIYSNVTTMNVKDPIIELGGTGNANPLTSNDGKDRGEILHVYDVAAAAQVDKFIGWDDSNAEFAFGSNVTTTNEVVTFNAFGNVRASYFLGNGSQLTGIDATSIQNGNSNVRVSANGNVTFGVTGVANVIIVTNTGANVTGTLNVSGNANVGNISGTTGVFTNVSGNGSALSSITGANVTGAVAYATTANAVAGANVSGQVSNALVAGTVYTAAQPNITSHGTLVNLYVNAAANAVSFTSNVATGTAPLTVTSTTRVANLNVAYANVADYINLTTLSTGNAYLILANAVTGNITEYANTVFVANTSNGAIHATTFVGALSGAATTAGTVTTNAQPNITSVGTLTSLAVTGNITSGNMSGTSAVVGTYSELTGSTATTTSTTQTAIATFAVATYGAAKFVVQASDGTKRHITELLVTHDGTNTFITEYGVIKTNTSLYDLTADINTGSVRLLATSTSANSTVYRVATNLLKL